MKILKNLKDIIKNNKFKYGTALLIIIIFILLSFIKFNPKQKLNKATTDNSNELLVFIQDGCFHCEKAEDFLSKNIDKYKKIKLSYHNLKNRDSQVLLFKNISKLNIPQDGLGTPIFIMNDNFIVGFNEEQQKNLVQMLKEKKIKRNK